MDYFIRYLSDSASIAEERSLSLVVDRVRATAVSLAVLGEVESGTRLLTILHEHGIPPFDYEEFGAASRFDEETFQKSLGVGCPVEDYPVRVSPPRADPYTRAVFCFAWEHTDTWPAWISIPRSRSDTAAALDALEIHAREVVCDRFGPEWKEDRDTFWAAFELSQTKRNRANPHGPIPLRIMKMWSLWERMICPWPFNQLLRATGRTIALDLAVRLGIRDQIGSRGDNAITFLGKLIVTNSEADDQVAMLGSMRALWQAGWFGTRVNMFLRGREIDVWAVRDAAIRGCDMLKKRLDSGPSRPYAGTTYGDLLKVIDEGTRANGCYDIYSMQISSVTQRETESESQLTDADQVSREDPLLYPPATDSEIASLESRLGISSPLPDSYKEFLKTSNGLRAIWWNRTQLLRLLSPISIVRVERDADIHDQTLSLIDDRELHGKSNIDWPPLTRAVAINISRFDGSVWLVEPEFVEIAKRSFFQTYDSSPPPEQDRLRRLAEETYGSLDALRNLQWATLLWTPWYAELIPYADVRSFLEVLAEGCQVPMSHWKTVFHPGVMQSNAALYRFTDDVEDGDLIDFTKSELILGPGRNFSLGGPDPINGVYKVVVDD